jgi:hypothetical protein
MSARAAAFQDGRTSRATAEAPVDTSNKSIKQPLTWFRLATGPLRILPDFIIIGAQKCGTSSLYRYLAVHPTVVASAGKEVHYFDWNYRRGTRWYRAHFPTDLSRHIFRMRTGQRLVTGEATPYYLFHPHVPRRIKGLVPRVKLIALLRDPVERALSAYEHQVRAGTESLPFLEAIDREGERLAKDTERLTGDDTYNSRTHRRFSYLARGVYADQLESWFEIFPREQLLVIRSEDLFEESAAVFAQVLDFLGLPRWQPRDFPRFNSAEYGVMDANVRRRLTDYFAPHNQRLYALLGRDFRWSR